MSQQEERNSRDSSHGPKKRPSPSIFLLKLGIIPPKPHSMAPSTWQNGLGSPAWCFTSLGVSILLLQLLALLSSFWASCTLPSSLSLFTLLNIHVDSSALPSALTLSQNAAAARKMQQDDAALALEVPAQVRASIVLPYGRGPASLGLGLGHVEEGEAHNGEMPGGEDTDDVGRLAAAAAKTEAPTAASRTKSCSGRRVYVYDVGKLPEQLRKEWERQCNDAASSSSSTQDHGSESSSSSGGAASALCARDGLGSDLTWWVTATPCEGCREYQFGADWMATQLPSLALLFRARLLAYDCLTPFWHLADAFYLPLVLPPRGSRSTVEGASGGALDMGSVGTLLQGFLEGQPAFRRNKGADHFVVFPGDGDWVSGTGSDPAYAVGRKGVEVQLESSVMLPAESLWPSNPTLGRVAIVSDSLLFSLPEQRSSRRFSLLIPPPTAFHPATQRDLLLWLRLVHKHERGMLFSFVDRGGIGPLAEELRSAIHNQCPPRSTDCWFMNCTQQCSDALCVQQLTGACYDPRQVAVTYLNSVFCLQPMAAAYSPRSIFDVLLTGCIPVFFAPETFPTQYAAHLGTSTSSISVQLSRKKALTVPLYVQTALQAVPVRRVKKMQLRIQRLIPRILYKNHAKSRLPDTFQDAFDISIDAIIDRVRVQQTAQR